MASLKRLFWVAALFACIGPAAATPAFVSDTSPALPTLDANTSLLVVAPHPDDETLCCAGVIRRVIEAGGHVSIVWITSGDGSALSMLFTEKSLFRPVEKVHDLARKRIAEARAAMGILGVASDELYFLGYPDGGIKKLVTDRALEKDFEAVLDHTQPNLVLMPSSVDTHPDHSASGELAYRVLSRRGAVTTARFWIVHGGEGWPNPRQFMPIIPLNIPPRGADLEEHEFTLSDAEVDLKHQAIEAYHTQMQFMAPFLLAFVRTSELYSLRQAPTVP
jgi:LmbE family N-acetylglucosaminyl deacetylase